MPRVSFTSNLQRHLSAPPSEVKAATVREALEQVFAQNPLVRSYVLDDQGAVRRHVVIFVGGEPIQDRERLSDKVEASDEIAVLQALSGG
jgi:sulfur carrier protein ThiS